MSTSFSRRQLLGTGSLGGALSLLSGGTVLAQPANGKGKHPHIHGALHRLRAAKKQLQEAAHDYGGHRSAAVAAVSTAIAECEQALKSKK